MNIKPWLKYQAVYVHIPFCVQKCLYCDFASYAGCNENAKNKYVETLCQEIALPLTLEVDSEATIYFGGGTPSTLSTEQLAHIVRALKDYGLWQRPLEATIEVNPGTVDLGKLQNLKEMGFTRVSMGVQSLNNSELCTIGRIHNGEQALEAIALAKQAGFQHINADVIYGLPGQTMTSLQKTLTTLANTSIDHISVYGLIVEEGTPLATLVESGKLLLPEDDTTADMYDFVQAFLEKQGFLRYEISNYAKRKIEIVPSEKASLDTTFKASSYSRHNDVYWRYLPYAAFGASAASFNGKTRYTRPYNLEAYEQWVRRINRNSKIENKCQITELGYKEIAEELSNAELLGEYMMMGLRRLLGANLQEAEERFGLEVLKLYAKELQPYFEKELLVYDARTKRLSLTAAGMAVGNQIFAIFV